MSDGSDGALPVSGLHELLAQTSERRSVRYASLATARSDPDAVVVLSGDDGGTVLLTVPLRLVQCDPAALHSLGVALDRLLWDDAAGVEVSFLRIPVGGSVAGGMGGGVVVDGVWVHPRFDGAVAARAAAVIAGESDEFESV